MVDWSNDLGLDPERLSLVARAYEGQGGAYVEVGEDRRLDAASCLTIAGSCWALLGEAQQAKRCFAAAASLHLVEGTAYSALLAICAGSDELLIRGLGQQLEKPVSEARADSAVGNALTAAFMAATGHERRSDAQRLLNLTLEQAGEPVLPTGRLALPSRLYVELFRAIESNSSDRLPGSDNGPLRPVQPPRLRRAVDEYFARVNEVLLAAMGDRFHWTRVMSPVLPAEPEILAFGIAATIAGRQHTDTPVSEWVRDKPARALAEACEALATGL